jgi:Zn-dependent peptidase ImmA (M78 family)/DNA-binding transcriptional regulator YiaG
VTGNPSRRHGRPQGQLGIWASPNEDVVAEAPVKKPFSRRRTYALCTPGMLAWARTSLGLSIQMAAKKLHLSDERLAAWEAGTERPTIPQLRACAQVYKRPLAAFYMDAPPRDFTVRNSDFRRLPGEVPEEYTPEMHLALRIAAYRREVALELDPDAEAVGLVGSATMDMPAEALAATARAALTVTLAEQASWSELYAPLNGWKNAVERLGILVFHFTDVGVDEVRGFSFGEPLFPVIGLNGGDSIHGRIFTLIHELGHLYLGEGGSCDLGDFTRPVEERGPAEVYCNRFAGAVLVPRGALLDDLTVRRADALTEWSDDDLYRLSRRFRVSREVVLRRLLTLGKADQEFYQTRRDEYLALPRRAKVKKAAPIPRPIMIVRDAGKPFARMVLDAYHADAISAPSVADYLGTQLKHLPAIEKRLASHDVLTGSAP